MTSSFPLPALLSIVLSLGIGCSDEPGPEWAESEQWTEWQACNDSPRLSDSWVANLQNFIGETFVPWAPAPEHGCDVLLVDLSAGFPKVEGCSHFLFERGVHVLDLSDVLAQLLDWCYEVLLEFCISI